MFVVLCGGPPHGGSRMESTANENILSKDYFTQEQLLALLNVTQRTLSRWELCGDGPPRTKLGRKALYRKSSVATWLESREVVAPRSGKKRGVR